MNYGHRFLTMTAMLVIAGLGLSLIQPEGFQWLAAMVGIAALIGGTIGAIHDLAAKADRMSPGILRTLFLSFRTDVFHANTEEDARAVVVLGVLLGGTSVIIAQLVTA